MSDPSITVHFLCEALLSCPLGPESSEDARAARKSLEDTALQFMALSNDGRIREADIILSGSSRLLETLPDEVPSSYRLSAASWSQLLTHGPAYVRATHRKGLRFEEGLTGIIQKIAADPAWRAALPPLVEMPDLLNVLLEKLSSENPPDAEIWLSLLQDAIDSNPAAARRYMDISLRSKKISKTVLLFVNGVPIPTAKPGLKDTLSAYFLGKYASSHAQLELFRKFKSPAYIVEHLDELKDFRDTLVSEARAARGTF